MRKSGETVTPAIAFAPTALLNELEVQGAPVVTLELRVKLDDLGIVKSSTLNQASIPLLEEGFRRALLLWQFIPKIDPELGSVESECILPISLALNPDFLSAQI